MENENNNEVEDKIFFSLKEKYHSVSRQEIEKLIENDLKLNGYEDWQMGYATERIIKRFNDPKEKLWNEYTNLFWILFVSHIVLNMVSRGTDSNIIVILQIVVVFIMIWCIEKYSYLFSKDRKLSIFQSLLGFVWFSVIGIFISYFSVKRSYYLSMGKDITNINKAIVVIIILVGLLYYIY